MKWYFKILFPFWKKKREMKNRLNLSIISLITWGITKRQGLGFGDIQLILVLGYWIGDFRILIIRPSFFIQIQKHSNNFSF